MSRHAVDLYHPALARLLRDQTKASLRRTLQRLTSRRRLVLSCLAIVLSLFWLGNVAVSVAFREPASLAHLRHWIPLGLLVYALWHVVKVSYRRPEQSIEWSVAEREILAAAPFSRGQLLTYRLASVVRASIFKAGCFVLLMLPDLPHVAFGFAGFLLALLSIELWRMTVEITACQVSRTTYQKLRIAVLTCVAMASASVVVIAGCAPAASADESPLLPLVRLGHAVVGLGDSPLGTLLVAPFCPFARVMFAEDISLAFALHVLMSVMLVAALAGVMSMTDRYSGYRKIARQRHAYDHRPASISSVAVPQTTLQHLPTLARQTGWVALVWRQSLGARHYWGSVLVAIAVPTFLALTPLLVHASPTATLASVIGAAAFYSLLLLPAALRFDFRRDVDRMSLLKSLPVTPTAMVVGQLLVPVALASFFQLLVFSIAAAGRPEDLGYLVLAWLVLVPMNVFIFALDNLLFLLYPHRLHQEGLEIFLRATLTFTAKGLLFVLGVAVTAVWALSTASLSRLLARGSDPTFWATVIFPIGMAFLLAVAAAVAFRLAVRAYRRYDPSQDAPA